jgi:hypothetical protein
MRNVSSFVLLIVFSRKTSMKLPEVAPSDSEHFKVDESRQVVPASVAVMAAATA